jgi:hypothetical protein
MNWFVAPAGIVPATNAALAVLANPATTAAMTINLTRAFMTSPLDTERPGYSPVPVCNPAAKTKSPVDSGYSAGQPWCQL